MNKPTAIVFAYHSVGVRGIKSLLASGVEIKLVVSHEDNPHETIWFESVADLCAEHGIKRVTPDNPNLSEFVAELRSYVPDYIFSFYYRNMLCEEILNIPSRGAYNLHGSLLPKYRGRVPVNWAVLHGETETGATLHEMTVKPDAGAIIGQVAVPILPDDTAFEVFGKLTVASEQVLATVLPGILAGAPNRIHNDLSKGSYFGGRKPEDGRIDWAKPAQNVYNLHRAVAPPYPGAFFEHNGERFIIEKARFSGQNAAEIALNLPQGISVVDNVVFGVCGDGKAIKILALQHNSKTLSIDEVRNYFA
ncbi:formyltransferase [Undibacterium sp. LX40W]|uniref:Formyltransferase n=1 Tax=Undibacterium nitidum TaxID=2762298 RepID=A0A923HLG8_9BURK|nr:MULTISPECIES: formyltransferase [Undibacterium]MBC3879996.1 formyltransferase [Undibacterium nitidum]MBC3891268.1 formyltransferase [Undibacterium sp. LX40W]